MNSKSNLWNYIIPVASHGERHFKTSGADHRPKVNVIKANAHKYGVSALCKVLNISRSTYYYEAKQKRDASKLTASVVDIFKASRNNYGTRKIKKKLAKQNILASRRKIGRIMKQEGLISNDTIAQFRPLKDTCNESNVANVVNRQFGEQPYRNVVVSDLTYVRVGMSWNYICVLIDLFNREIIGYSAGRQSRILSLSIVPTIVFGSRLVGEYRCSLFTRTA